MIRDTSDQDTRIAATPDPSARRTPLLIGQAALAFELFFGATPPEGRDEELRALLMA